MDDVDPMIYFLIPVYNEEQNLKQLCTDLKNVLADQQRHYVFVDDCSSDGSIDVLRQELPLAQLQILSKEGQRGPGDSFNRGFEWILEHSNEPADLIVTLEGDNTSDLDILNRMILISELGYQLVLASVYAQGGSFDKTSFMRKVSSSAANFIFRFFFGIRVQTLSSFYRVYHVDLLRLIKERYGSIIKEAGFISMLEVLVKAIRLNAPIIEVPVKLMSQMRKGQSKMKKVRTMMDYIRFLLTFRDSRVPIDFDHG